MENVINEIYKIIPGISSKRKVSIKVNKSSKTINVNFIPKKDIINIFDLCKKISALIENFLTLSLDMSKDSYKILLNANNYEQRS